MAAATMWQADMIVMGNSARSVLVRKVLGDTIVGSYLDEMFNLRAFHFDGTNYHSIMMPASTSSWAKDVSGGVIVGDTFFESGGNAFRLDDSTLSVFGYPGATLTSPEAISGSTIVGSYDPGLESHGFVYDETGWSTLDYPGASRTRLLGVSDAGIVGQFGLNDPFVHSFLYAQGSFQELRYPDSLATEVWDMDGNFIVGNYADGNGVHGFLARLRIQCEGVAKGSREGIIVLRHRGASGTPETDVQRPRTPENFVGVAIIALRMGHSS